jgi:hypothetical protein
VAGIPALLQFLFFAFVLGPFLGERLIAGLAFQQAEAALDRVAGHRPEQNTLLRGGDDGACAVLDMEQFAQSEGDDYLPFGGEPNRVSFICRTHNAQYDSKDKSVKSYLVGI